MIMSEKSIFHNIHFIKIHFRVKHIKQTVCTIYDSIVDIDRRNLNLKCSNKRCASIYI